ncbi:MAG TPA: hypothetical protein VK463_21185 [Desulfomonilaceae bacterium]|nr:hypothetical protein [Desulfomonilaceae bacterium]
MLGKCVKYLFVLPLLATVSILSAVAWADSTSPTYDPCAGIKPITKVKPAPTAPAVPTAPLKVKPWGGLSQNFEALSQYNPITWGPDCCLPAPAKGQFVFGPKALFARIQGEVKRGVETVATQPSVVSFDDHLGFKKTGNVIWSIEAMYQLRPKWGIRYSFTPLSMEATATPISGFTFGGQTFATGTSLHSKWDRFEHRAGMVFTVSRTPASQTSVFADWMNIQDKLSVSSIGLTAPVTMQDTKNVAVLGLEFDRCLKNYKGNTLSLNGKGGIAFLSDSIGYEAQASLSYLIPIKTGRFGFVKAGYQYEHLKKEKTTRMFGTTVDGPFVQLGFLF